MSHIYLRPKTTKVSSPGVRFHNSAISWDLVLMFGPGTGFIIYLSLHTVGHVEVRYTFNVKLIVCWICRGSADTRMVRLYCFDH